MRNSSLVKRLCAENVTGLSIVPKLWISLVGKTSSGVVGKRSMGDTSTTVRTYAAHGSEYAGISNDKTDEKSVRRKSKVSWARLILPG